MFRNTTIWSIVAGQSAVLSLSVAGQSRFCIFRATTIVSPTLSTAVAGELIDKMDWQSLFVVSSTTVIIAGAMMIHAITVITAITARFAVAASGSTADEAASVALSLAVTSFYLSFFLSVFLSFFI